MPLGTSAYGQDIARGLDHVLNGLEAPEIGGHPSEPDSVKKGRGYYLCWGQQRSWTTKSVRATSIVNARPRTSW